MPPTPDSEVVGRLFLFLEDRRVLYNPAEVEMPEHCVESVLEMRLYLSRLLDDGGLSGELVAVFRGLRGACRAFLDRVSSRHESGIYLPGGGLAGLHDWDLNQALGELRAAFGLQLARLAATYDLDVPEILVATLPPEPE